MKVNEAIAIAEAHGLIIPEEILDVITQAPLGSFFNSPDEIYAEACGGEAVITLK